VILKSTTTALIFLLHQKTKQKKTKTNENQIKKVRTNMVRRHDRKNASTDERECDE